MRVRIASGIVERVEGIAGGGGEEEGGRGKRGRGMDAGAVGVGLEREREEEDLLNSSRFRAFAAIISQMKGFSSIIKLSSTKETVF